MRSVTPTCVRVTPPAGAIDNGSRACCGPMINPRIAPNPFRRMLYSLTGIFVGSTRNACAAFVLPFLDFRVAVLGHTFGNHPYSRPIVL